MFEWEYYWKNKNIPSPKGLFGIGHLIDIMKDFKECDNRWKEECGETYGLMLMGTPELLTTNLDLIREIYVKQFENFIDRESFSPESTDKDKSLLTSGMFTKRGEAWRRIRNLCSPAFSSAKMKMFVTFFNQSADKTIEILEDYFKNNKEVDMKELCDGMTLDSIFKSIFGYKIDIQEDPDNIVRTYAKKFFNVDIKNPSILILILFPYTCYLLRKYFDYHVGTQIEHRFFKDLLSKCLERRRRKLKCHDSNEAPDFFNVLLHALEEDNKYKDSDEEISFEKATQKQKNKGMSEYEILGQGFLFLLSGYETTSTSIHFILFMLAYHQEYQDKCREEIFSALRGKDLNYIDYETVNKLDYLEQCIKEGLRMYPPAGRINRVCVNKTTVNGIVFEPGTNVSVSIFNLHYDENVYLEPDVFNPERFSSEQKTLRDPLHYLPFGYGPRNCIGMRYAYLSMKVYLAKLLTKFIFVTCDKSTKLPIRIDSKGITKPSDKLILKVNKVNDDKVRFFF
uniref:Cytochrome P450 n=1 Tax=Parastrongyloides trichosuri TaxID=131310 RepID=A0A0N4ZZF4_PARTI